MKKQLGSSVIWLTLVCWFLSVCSPRTSINNVPETHTVTPVNTKTIATVTPLPTLTLTSTPFQIVFPAITLSPQESENALLELLRTNGNCTGKCIAGIRPDEMNVQDAVDIMSQWGMVSVYKDFFGRTNIDLEAPPLYGKVGVYLSMGTRTKEFENIDWVSFIIQNAERGGGRTETNLWAENRNNWKSFRLDNLLRAYGVPSYVGYDFYRLFAGPLNEGRNIGYIMEIQYQEMQLVINSQAMAYYDGKNVFLCPTKDPQLFTMEIYPERPLDRRQEFASVKWQSLTNSDLQMFYQIFTDETNPDACVTTNLEQIKSLKPSFH